MSVNVTKLLELGEAWVIAHDYYEAHPFDIVAAAACEKAAVAYADALAESMKIADGIHKQLDNIGVKR